MMLLEAHRLSALPGSSRVCSLQRLGYENMAEDPTASGPNPRSQRAAPSHYVLPLHFCRSA